MGFIYAISCNISKKIYIGQTKNTIEYRWKAHIYRARYERQEHVKKSCRKLYNAMRKYGHENFRVVKLAEVSDDQLDDVEKKYIAEFNTIKFGYNIKPGGASAGHSEETRKLMSKKISEARKNDFKKFRKHAILEGLPQHCMYRKDSDNDYESFIIVKHPLCKTKKFSIKQYGTIEKAREALLEYYAKLEQDIVPEELNKWGLPNNIHKIKKGYYVRVRYGDKKHGKSFTKADTDTQNKADAIAWLNEWNIKVTNLKEERLQKRREARKNNIAQVEIN